MPIPPLQKTAISLQVMLATAKKLYPTNGKGRAEFMEGWVQSLVQRLEEGGFQ